LLGFETVCVPGWCGAAAQRKLQRREKGEVGLETWERAREIEKEGELYEPEEVDRSKRKEKKRKPWEEKIRGCALNGDEPSLVFCHTDRQGRHVVVEKRRNKVKSAEDVGGSRNGKRNCIRRKGEKNCQSISNHAPRATHSLLLRNDRQ
jgi:hypothetical protein